MRNAARLRAEELFTAALKKTDAQTLLEGVMRYAAERDGENPKFTKNPSTWLNAESSGSRTSMS